MRTTMAIETISGLFIGQRRGDCIKLSIPAQTDNDWGLNAEFLDLPLMDEETYNVFSEAIIDMKKLFINSEGKEFEKT